MRRLEGHNLDVMAVAFAPTGQWLASAGWDGDIRLWDLETGQCVRRIHTSNEHALDVAFSPDGRYLAAGFRHDGGLESHHRDYGTVAWFPCEPIGDQSPDWFPPGDSWNAHQTGTRSVSFSPDGKHLLTCGTDASEIGPGAMLWDLTQRKVRMMFGRRSFQEARFRPDGNAIAAAGPDGIFVWESSTGAAFNRIPKTAGDQGDRCRAVAWSPQGDLLAAVFDSGRITWWNPDSHPRSGLGHHDAAVAVAFSPDGRLLLTAGKNGLIYMWDNSTFSRIAVFDWEIGDIHGVAFAPDGLTAAAAGFETILLWDVD